MKIQIQVLPNLGIRSSKVLRRLVLWDKEYRSSQSSASPAARARHPSTERVAQHFKMSQPEALKVLNELERDGLLIKTRRLWTVPAGHGFNGSLYSAIRPTQRAIDLVDQHPWEHGE